MKKNFCEKLLGFVLIGTIAVLYVLNDISALEAVTLGSLNGLYLGASLAGTVNIPRLRTLRGLLK